MVGDGRINEWFEKLKGLSPIGKIQKTIHPTMDYRREIGRMRAQLLTEFREPFINRVDTTSPDIQIKEVKIRNFDERVKTLPDEYIVELYENAVKNRAVKGEKKKEEVQNYILESLELSYYMNGWCVDRMVRRK